jgi:hypothetical protein
MEDKNVLRLPSEEKTSDCVGEQPNLFYLRLSLVTFNFCRLKKESAMILSYFEGGFPSSGKA